MVKEEKNKLEHQLQTICWMEVNHKRDSQKTAAKTQAKKCCLTSSASQFSCASEKTANLFQPILYENYFFQSLRLLSSFVTIFYAIFLFFAAGKWQTETKYFFITFDNFVVIYDVKIKLCNVSFIVMEKEGRLLEFNGCQSDICGGFVLV